MTKMTNKYISLVCDGVTYHETGIDMLPELWINKTTLIFGKSLDNLPEKFF